MGRITLSLTYPILRWHRLGAPLTQTPSRPLLPNILRVLTESDIWRGALMAVVIASGTHVQGLGATVDRRALCAAASLSSYITMKDGP